MRQKGFVSIILVVIIVALAGTVGYFVFKKKSTPTPPENPQHTTTRPQISDNTLSWNCKDPTTLPLSAQQVVQASRDQMKTEGISDDYFNKHFCLADSQDNKNENYQMEIEWKYNIGDYTGTFNSGTPIKYQTLPSGYKVRTLTVKQIENVIPLNQAIGILQKCLGTFSYAGSVYDFPSSKLYLQASPDSYPKGYSFVLGRVDLETGQCHVEKSNPL